MEFGPVILAIDVHYLDSTAKVAGVLFDIWDTNAPTQEVTCQVDHIEPYKSGRFFKREWPCILALLEKHRFEVDCIVVDGYVFLGNQVRIDTICN